MIASRNEEGDVEELDLEFLRGEGARCLIASVGGGHVVGPAVVFDGAVHAIRAGRGR